MNFLKNRSTQVFLVVGVYLAIQASLPLQVHQGLYTLSLFIKDLLLWMLPLTVSVFIASSICSFERKAPLFILALLLFEAFSNAASVWYAYGCGHLTAHFLSPSGFSPSEQVLAPLWRLSLIKPAWWSADKGSFLGVVLGLLAVFRFPSLEKALVRGRLTAEWILTRGFSRLVPLFILGFVARMVQTGLLRQMLAQSADLVLFLFAFIALYIALLFFLGSLGSHQSFWNHLKNIAPAVGMAFSSSCSLSTMPLTIEGTSKNLKDPSLARAMIPATTNIQQIGDCIANAFLCFLIYRHFNGHNPSFAVWISFSTVFVLARFATAAVTGGAIFMMLPIYESYLGFTAEMTAIILAFNVLLDPLITCANVTANSGLCRLFEKVWHSSVFSKTSPSV